MRKDPNRMYELLKKWAADPDSVSMREVAQAREDVRYKKEKDEELRLRNLEKKYNIRILRKHERIDDSAWEGVR